MQPNCLQLFKERFLSIREHTSLTVKFSSSFPFNLLFLMPAYIKVNFPKLQPAQTTKCCLKEQSAVEIYSLWT